MSKHTCPTCGYEWQHGKHGGHSCSDRLEVQRHELLEALKELSNAVIVSCHPSHILRHYAASADKAIAKAEGGSDA